MAGRTFAIGDVHGDLAALEALLGLLPPMDADDTVVFLGDYVDRGPESAKVVDLVRVELPRRLPAKLVALKGNHEDAWLRVAKGGWLEFTLPTSNGCLACLRSYTGGSRDVSQGSTEEEFPILHEAKFYPPEVLAWMSNLPNWYEDKHAIYVHAGLPCVGPRWLHPVMVKDPSILLWLRDKRFFTEYKGKRVVCGHTTTTTLPQELSHYTPECDTDLWQGDYVLAIDTGAGKPNGFLTAVELPGGKVYESHHAPKQP